MVASSIESFVAGLRTKRKIVYLRGDAADEFLNSFRKLPITPFYVHFAAALRSSFGRITSELATKRELPTVNLVYQS